MLETTWTIGMNEGVTFQYFQESMLWIVHDNPFGMGFPDFFYNIYLGIQP